MLAVQQPTTESSRTESTDTDKTDTPSVQLRLGWGSGGLRLQRPEVLFRFYTSCLTYLVQGMFWHVLAHLPEKPY